MIDLLPLFVAVPLGAAFLTLLLKGAAPRAAPGIAIASCAFLLVASVLALVDGLTGAALLGGWGVHALGEARFVVGIAMVLDGLSALFLVLVAVVSSAVAVYSLRYLDRYGGKPYFYALFDLLVAGMCGAVLAGDVFNLFVFVEVASIASYALVAFGTGGREVEAAFKYLVLGEVASTAILLAIAVLYGAAGFLNMADLALAVRSGQVGGTVLFFASALFLGGFGLKAATMPFHAWLPDAHPSAPAPISAMLSGLLIKTLGIYAIVRVFYTVLGVDPRVQTLLLVLGSVSMGAGVLLALGQEDMKRLLAYHSVSQMGYVIVGLGVGTPLAIAGAIFHAVNHGLFKSALFLSAGSLERITGTRNLYQMGGLVRKAPATAVGAIGASLSIAGVPPFNGFWSKLMILIAVLDAGYGLVAAIVAGTAFFTLVSFIKVQRRALFGPLPPALQDAKDVPWSMSVPVLALSALCLLTAVLWPLGFDKVLDRATEVVRPADPETDPADAYVRLIPGRQP